MSYGGHDDHQDHQHPVKLVSKRMKIGSQKDLKNNS